MGLNFMGSYCGRTFAAVSKKRRICGSVAVAQRATRYKRKKISTPPSKLLRRLKVAAPRHMAKKKSFRSAPRIVSGRESDRDTRLIRLGSATFVSVGNLRNQLPGKSQVRKFTAAIAMPTPNKHAGQHAFRAAFAECEGETGNDDGHKRKPASDGAGESGLQNAHRVFPRRIATALGEGRRGKK